MTAIALAFQGTAIVILAIAQVLHMRRYHSDRH
jgi:hypothetical protein